MKESESVEHFNWKESNKKRGRTWVEGGMNAVKDYENTTRYITADCQADNIKNVSWLAAASLSYFICCCISLYRSLPGGSILFLFSANFPSSPSLSLTFSLIDLKEDRDKTSIALTFTLIPANDYHLSLSLKSCLVCSQFSAKIRSKESGKHDRDLNWNQCLFDLYPIRFIFHWLIV